MGEMTDADLWLRLERTVEMPSRAASSTGTPAAGEKMDAGKSFRRWIRVLDVVAAITWLYVLIKIFAIDIDRVLLEGPSSRATAPVGLALATGNARVLSGNLEGDESLNVVDSG